MRRYFFAVGIRIAQKSHASRTYAHTQYWCTGCIVLWFRWKPESYCVYERPGRTLDNSSFRSALTLNQFAIMIHYCSQFGTNHSMSNSSIFTSRSRLVVNPLSGLMLYVRVVMVHSASSMGCLKPLTFTGISV